MSEYRNLGNIVKQRQGFAFSSDDFNLEEGDTVVLTPGNFTADGGLYFGAKTKFFHGEYSAEYRLNNGDLVLVMTDLTKEMNILGSTVEINSDKTILLNQRIAKLDILDGVELNKDFLRYYLNGDFARRHLKKHATGTTVRHISTKTLMSLPVLLPPIDEQQAIVEILSDCDSAIEYLEQKLSCLRSNMIARIEELIWKNNQPRSEISSVCTPINEKVLPANMPAQTRCIELENIDAAAAGTINGFVAAEGLSSQKTKFDSGDVLFGKLRPYLRKFAFAEFEGICSTEIWALRSHSERMLGKYLFYVMSSERVFAVANKSFGSKMPRADWGLLSTLPIPTPDVEKQGNVVKALDFLKDEINQTIELKSLYQRQKCGLMQQLLTGKLRVKGAA